MSSPPQSIHHVEHLARDLLTGAVHLVDLSHSPRSKISRKVLRAHDLAAHSASASQDLFVRESDGRRGIRLRRRLLHEPIECKTSGYGDDDRHHTSDDERAHGERPSTSKNFASSSHHSTTTTLPHLFVNQYSPVRRPGAIKRSLRPEAALPIPVKHSTSCSPPPTKRPQSSISIPPSPDRRCRRQNEWACPPQSTKLPLHLFPKPCKSPSGHFM